MIAKQSLDSQAQLHLDLLVKNSESLLVGWVKKN